MRITGFRDMYLAELQELRDVEAQLASALDRLSAKAGNANLADLFRAQADETRTQEKRVARLLQRHDAAGERHADQAMQAILHETDKMLVMVEGEELRDSALIASAQKAMHYQIAAFGTAAALAGQLHIRDDQETLHAGLEEKKRADLRLTELAKREVNPEAVAAT